MIKILIFEVITTTSMNAELRAIHLGLSYERKWVQKCDFGDRFSGDITVDYEHDGDK